MFLRRHAFKIAVLALCAAMGIYLLITYVWKPEAALPVLQSAPEFEMNDIDGNPVSLSSTNGKVRLVYYYFANCPDVCPPTTFLLSEAQDKLRAEGKLGSEAELISITFDPERDSPDAIRQFAERTSAELDGWHFLRGDGDATIELARKMGVSVVKDPESGTFSHMNLIVLIDKDGQIRQLIKGSDENLDANYIVNQVNKLL
ncbi:SCO family protein [Paenibacillus sp. LHD-117]|uniref:SCO family protein n=1 Tax=Paenibacillus sp. LHD-117 TaxID=3071412 RepID=UPI0027E06BE3|nr:SCO family protein [Paenibacillus sp. LHD-117]MDQ6419824.1 SCO family protein [Paenibacillus sp. LHD-117]